MENKKFRINGESSARKCGVFNDLFEKGIREYAGINVLEDGKLLVVFMAPNITSEEIRSFTSEPLKLYGLHLGSDCYAILTRGMVSIDTIIDPNVYDDNRLEKIKGKNECLCFLLDSNSDEIKGIRVGNLNERAISFVSDNAKRMSEMGINSFACKMAFSSRIMPYTPKQLEKLAVYYGKNAMSFTPSDLFLAAG